MKSLHRMDYRDNLPLDTHCGPIRRNNAEIDDNMRVHVCGMIPHCHPSGSIPETREMQYGVKNMWRTEARA